MSISRRGFLATLLLGVLSGCGGGGGFKFPDPQPPSNLPANGRLALAQSSGFVTVNPDGTQARAQLAGEVLAVAWSPNGSQLALVLTDGRLFIVDPNAPVLTTPLTTIQTGFGGLRLTWSPDGKRLAFDSFVNAQTLEVINTDGSGQRVVASNDVGQPAWSLDSQQLLYSAQGFSQLRVINADGTGGERTLYTAPSGERVSFATPSPDGSRIVFSGNNTLRSVKLDGTDLRTIKTNIASNGGALAISPDARRIAYYGRTGASQGVYTVSASGGNAQLVKSPVESFYPGSVSWGTAPLVPNVAQAARR